MFNCIGHNNHRYFMLFIVYMWLGTCYVVNCGWTRIFVLLDIRSVSLLVGTLVLGVDLVLHAFVFQKYVFSIIEFFGLVSEVIL